MSVYCDGSAKWGLRPSAAEASQWKGREAQFDESDIMIHLHEAIMPVAGDKTTIAINLW